MIDFPATPTTGQIFTVGGASWRYNGASWAAYTGSLVGDITSVVAGTGLTGGGTSGDVTLNLANTAVAAGSYTYATLTVDAQGRLTAASNGATPGTVTSITAGTGLTGGTITATGTIGLAVPVSVANGGTGATTTAGAPWLPLAGGQLNPGGLLIGTAGSVPAGAGLMINAAASAPAVAVPIPAGVSIIGDAGGEARVFLDSYSGAGGAITPGLYARKARGTAAAPTAVQTNDALFVVDCSGRGATGYGPSASTYLAVAAENWSDTAQGTYTAFYTTNLGTTTAVQRMFLRQGLIVGPLATPDPGPGSLTLNANTVAPPAGLTPNLYVVGANNTDTALVLDNFGNEAATINRMQFRGARGTAAAPTAIQNGDYLVSIEAKGYTGSAYSGGSASINVTAAENWTTGAQGSRIIFGTTPTGTNVAASSLTLAGNTATFSGTIGVGGAGPQILTDGANLLLRPTTAANGILLQNIGGTTNLLVAAGNGDLTISGSNAQKASGTVWINPSSRDIKTDIKDYDAGLQAILSLRPRTYKFRKDSGLPTDGTHIGLVHDETSHMPEMHTKAVLGGSPDKPGREVDALDCSAITFALCNAIKELKAELDSLKAQLAGA